ncbi:MAG: hypothetical protein PF636_05480 [Actinomycetota bacterium]|jgi:hypothetical protein|nr:hypothetical protein [Actinomycetota bacterium]
MRHVFIVLTFSGTLMSWLIKMRYPAGGYCHVSLALDENLERMYSFGRKGTYNAFNAGFIREDLDKGVFRIKDVRSRVYSMQVTDEQYRSLLGTLEGFERDRDEYRFDIVGLLLRVVSPRFNLARDKHYYCSRFVGELLRDSGSADLPVDPRLMHPTMFSDLKGMRLLHEGSLRVYRAKRHEKIAV